MASTLLSAQDCCSPCSHTVTVTIHTSASTGGEGDISIFNTTAALRAQPTSVDNVYAITLGDAAPGDGLSRQYWWDNTGTDADNGASVIRPNDYTTGGVWRQLF